MPEPMDKWQLLEQLTLAASAYGLTHRSLGVLRALLTFLPQRMIPRDAHEAIVFPSNKTLSKRLNGMPESTLRRHLAQLVKAGIVSRHDSANRKRFARRSVVAGQVAFGFDLAPLAQEAPQIAARAEQVMEAQRAAAALRADVGHLRQQLIDLSGPSATTDAVFRALRRIPDLAGLQDLQTTLHEQIEAHSTTKMSTTDSQNERHIHKELISNSDSVVDVETPANKPADVAFEQIVAQCTEYQSYFPAPLRHWDDVINIASRLVPMMGIDRPVFDEAIRVIGLRKAATVILCLLEKLDEIRNPGGYLRRITQQSRAGRFDWGILRSFSGQTPDIVS